MEDFSRHYKYSCRDCSAQQACIDAKRIAPGVKLIIARAFEQRTDTDETWALLQADCVLVQRDQQQAATPTPRLESGLLQRMRQAQQGQERPSDTVIFSPEPRPAAKPAEPATGDVPKMGVPGELSLPWPPPTHQPRVAPAAARALQTEVEGTHCFFVMSTRRFVRLPGEGGVVLGRFEYNLGKPPDVDLTYDQGEIQSLSRHHAEVTGAGGQHWIEDLGSTYGTCLNGRKLFMCEKAQLSQGDRVLLGECELIYGPLPEWALKPDVSVLHACFLVVTHIGHRIGLPLKKDVVVGRADPTLGFLPDIDLSLAGNVAKHVSRRHARLTVRGGWHFVEDMGSTTGTRLNGKAIRASDSPVLLHPGDQLWLGGCVLAYEWRLIHAK